MAKLSAVDLWVRGCLLGEGGALEVLDRPDLLGHGPPVLLSRLVFAVRFVFYYYYFLIYYYYYYFYFLFWGLGWCRRVWGLGFEGLGFGVRGLGVQVLGFRVQGVWLRVSGFGFRVEDSGFNV